MTVFYEKDAFGPGNRFCSCPHTTKHENTDQELESSRTYSIAPGKRKRVRRPRIKFQDSRFLQSEVTDMLYFFDESSNISGTSDPADGSEENTQHNSRIQHSFSEIVQGNRLEVFESTTERDSDKDSEGELGFVSYFEEKEETNSSSAESEGETKNVANSLERIQGLEHFRASALVMSLVSIVSAHNASDELLHDLLKRDQILFSN